MASGIGVMIKWVGSSVSGLVVIAGIVSIILGATLEKTGLIPLGAFFVIAGLAGALLMTLIIRRG